MRALIRSGAITELIVNCCTLLVIMFSILRVLKHQASRRPLAGIPDKFEVTTPKGQSAEMKSLLIRFRARPGQPR
jgi:hypothetical protein